MQLRKAQASMMEYIIMTFFMMIIITFMVMMFLGIQFMNIDSESSKQKMDRSLALMKSFSKTPLFSKDSSITEDTVIYDKKLTAAMLNEAETCENLRKIFGLHWSIEVAVIDGETEQLCDWTDYDNCNKWILCEEEITEGVLIRDIPVNVYRDSTDTVEAGLMTVKTYV
ncbi:MAG: hypothetical protein KKB03_03700 [Nanoarchaeota archaeon]|nr:hypothetical protein [Nanoarchaeota archaeon]MBU2520318.1 hypothetical protein [Nanoarchaeota archaeon]